MLMGDNQGNVYPRYCQMLRMDVLTPPTNFDPEADQDWILPLTFTASGYVIHHPLSSDVYNNSLESVATLTLCEYASSGGSSGGGIVDIALGTGKDPKYQSKRKRRGMRSATGRQPLSRASNVGSCDCGMNTRLCNMDVYASCKECCDAFLSDKMLRASGGGKTKVATAVNWLNPLI